MRYIELNPVHAGLVAYPEDWPWSSARAHIHGTDDILVKSEPLRKMVHKDWKPFLAVDVHDSEMELFRKHEQTGRPLGADAFVDQLEHLLDRTLKPQKPGPKSLKEKNK